VRRYRSLKRTTAPAAEPITLSEAKSHIRVDTAFDDTLITGYIKTAREWVEDYIDRALITQRLVMTLDTFPEEIELPRPPMVTVGTATAVTVTFVTGEAGGTATLATTDYRVDRDSTPGIIRNTYAGSWPSHLIDKNSVTVSWWAGYGSAADVPQRAKTAMLMCVHELYEKRGDGHMPDAAKRLLDTVAWGSYT
jgi:uncharacterized phiE125 gp8 family phage protein